MDPSQFGGFDQLMMQALGGSTGAGMPRSLIPQPGAPGMDFGKLLGGLGPLAMGMMGGAKPGQPAAPQFQNLQGPGMQMGQVPQGMPQGPLALANAIKQRSPY